MGEAGALALYADELDMPAVRALLAAGPNHLGAAQPLPVATSDTLPPLLHTQVGLVPVWSGCRCIQSEGGDVCSCSCRPFLCAGCSSSLRIWYICRWR